MRILVKNKKWETSFESVTLVCDVKKADKGLFHIQFPYNGKHIQITYCNLDLTFQHLEKLFNKFGKVIHQTQFLAS